MLNVSSEPGGIGSGVLLRALEPLYGIEHMQRNASHVKLSDLTRGPGRLAAALRVDRRHDGLNLFTDKQLWIGSDGHEIESVGESVRIGLTKAADERSAFLYCRQPLPERAAAAQQLKGVCAAPALIVGACGLITLVLRSSGRRAPRPRSTAQRAAMSTLRCTWFGGGTFAWSWTMPR